MWTLTLELPSLLLYAHHLRIDSVTHTNLKIISTHLDRLDHSHDNHMKCGWDLYDKRRNRFAGKHFTLSFWLLLLIMIHEDALLTCSFWAQKASWNQIRQLSSPTHLQPKKDGHENEAGNHAAVMPPPSPACMHYSLCSS